MQKGSSFNYLGHTIEMCTNGDGIVLLGPNGEHRGNYGENVELAKRYATFWFMVTTPSLQSTAVSRLNHHIGGGHYHDFSLFKKAVEKAGYEMPEDIKPCNEKEGATVITNNTLDLYASTPKTKTKITLIRETSS